MDAPLPTNLVRSWETFLENEVSRECQTLYPEVFRHPVLFPLQRSLELAATMDLLRELKPRVIAEIGTDKAGTFYHWIRQPSVERAVGVEIRGVPWEHAFRRALPHLDLLAIGASSRAQSTLDQVRAFLGAEQIDCLFLDGEKAAVDKDFETWLPFMAPGGVVFIHDIVDDIPPRRFWWSLRNRYRIGAIVDCREAGEVDAIAKEAPAYGEWLRIWRNTSCGVGIVHL